MVAENVPLPSFFSKHLKKNEDRLPNGWKNSPFPPKRKLTPAHNIVLTGISPSKATVLWKTCEERIASLFNNNIPVTAGEDYDDDDDELIGSKFTGTGSDDTPRGKAPWQ